MQEVKIRLRFNRECLGFAKQKLTGNRGVIYRMPRERRDRVMFLPSWWKIRLRYAAKVLNRYHREVDQIAWAPVIDGHLSEWKRFLPAKEGKKEKKRRYTLHEAFRPGTVIGVNAVLPNGLSLDNFTELLEVVGTYKGISPFQSDDEVYGTFEVESVMPTIRKQSTETNI